MSLGGGNEGAEIYTVHHHSVNIVQALEGLSTAVTEAAPLSAASWLLQGPFCL